MTTTTEPPLVDEPSIDVDQLPAWDQPDERACELTDIITGDSCKNRAAWAVTLAGQCLCDDVADVETDLWCDPHLRAARSTNVPACDRCWTYLRITRAEPIR